MPELVAILALAIVGLSGGFVFARYIGYYRTIRRLRRPDGASGLTLAQVLTYVAAADIQQLKGTDILTSERFVEESCARHLWFIGSDGMQQVGGFFLCQLQDQPALVLEPLKTFE